MLEVCSWRWLEAKARHRAIIVGGARKGVRLSRTSAVSPTETGRPHDTSSRSFSQMHRPNFCAECGVKIIRLHWHPWTSRRFCDACARRLRKERLMLPLITAIIVFSIGMVTGKSIRPPAPALIIQRSANSPLYGSQDMSGNGSVGAAGATQSGSAAPASPVEEAVYICGARTKKGTPCSRRMHEPVRCWQHKGMKAMLPPQKLIVKD